jgi:hypothetical protein
VFRPWRQDDRPTWWARVHHELLAPLDARTRRAVERQAGATGLTPQALVTGGGGSITVTLLVKAETAEEAARAATRIVEAAHREAGHGLLGRRLPGTALRHQPGRPTG